MNIRKTFYAFAFWLSTAFLLAVFPSIASAQSGRVIPKPSPTPQAALPPQPEAKPTFVIDVNADKYKLVFPTSFERVPAVGGKRNQADAERARHVWFNSFIEALNRAGAQGYRLISVVDGSMAFVGLDEVQYEYAWFETVSHMHFARNGFAEKYAALARQGFRLADHTLISASCDAPDENLVENCEYRDLFLLEREKGKERPVAHRMVASVPGWGSKPAEEMNDGLQSNMAAGFYPVGLLSRFEVLFERETERDERATGKQDVQLVRPSSFWETDKLPKSINEMARQGYRLDLVNKGIAVMSRPEGGAIPATYIWLKVGKRSMMMRRQKRDFEKQLAQLQASGAIYRMTYPNEQGDESELIFEQAAATDGRKREYRVLRFDTEEVDAGALKLMVQIDLTPASKEALRELNRLAKEGFVVRDLFMTDEASVLLERTQ